MIIMDIRLDNLLCFNDFHMNYSYPKKIIDSYIDGEFLSGRPNFRYKKVNIIMGSNATGKTSLGKVMMSIFNFIENRNLEHITKIIADSEREASFSLDFVLKEADRYVLYRIETVFSVPEENEYNSDNITVRVKTVNINVGDNYEKCAKKLDESVNEHSANYVTELEKVRGLSWFFVFPADSPQKRRFEIGAEEKLLIVLEKVLKVLDPAIMTVEKIEAAENSFVIRMKGKEIIVQDGKMAKDKEELLSTGTKAGIEIAYMIASIYMNYYAFYYCDEKFSFISSDIEKALLALMISNLGNDIQLFFTSHNTDILDLPLPKHSFNFLRKEVYDGVQYVSAENAGDYIKKNTDSVRNAVINDMFASAAPLEILDEIDSL